MRVACEILGSAGSLPNTISSGSCRRTQAGSPRSPDTTARCLISCFSTLGRWRRGRDFGCLGSMFWPRTAESEEAEQPGCSQRNKPGNPNCVTCHYREGDQAIGRGKSDQTENHVDPRGPDRARTEQCDEQDRCAVKQHADATDKMIGLQGSDCGSE